MQRGTARGFLGRFRPAGNPVPRLRTRGIPTGRNRPGNAYSAMDDPRPFGGKPKLTLRETCVGGILSRSAERGGGSGLDHRVFL